MVYLFGATHPIFWKYLECKNKKKIRIMMGYKKKFSCRNLFRGLEILPFVSQYILLLMLFVVKNKIMFILNSKIHTKSTQQTNTFYQPITNLTVYQNEYITWALRFLTIFLHTLKIYLIISGNFKFT